ncbi:hypothetical protein CYMTET_35987 [Cymbomonas tetramitiformis]|uniref:Uncharacterized protein n=1 Tax=Cymbomonas tetramitiformis TaxID=36881 RepID=A0AAE0F850_9CHLO|nr:hypothetical protein CYMTET_35987 [Cymbomonas tetramitiformis]
MADGPNRRLSNALHFGVGKTGAGFGIGCGVGIGVGAPINFESMGPLGGITAGLSAGISSIRSALAPVEEKLSPLVQKFGPGMKGIKAGVGCGVGLGYGFGAGIMLKPGVATNFAASAQEAVGALAAKAGVPGLVPTLPGVGGASGTSEGPNAQPRADYQSTQTSTTSIAPGPGGQSASSAISNTSAQVDSSGAASSEPQLDPQSLEQLRISHDTLRAVVRQQERLEDLQRTIQDNQEQVYAEIKQIQESLCKVDNTAPFCKR